MMYKVGKFVTAHPIGIICTVAIITILFAVSCTRLTFESDIKKLLPSNSTSVVAYREIDEKFGGADQLFILIESKNVFSHETLSKVRALGNVLKTISGVSKIFSITDMDEIRQSRDGIEISPILTEIPTRAKDLLRFKKRLLSDEKYAGKFVSKDGTATLVVAKLFINREDSTVRDAKEICKKFEGPETILLTGAPYVAQSILEDIRKDLLRLIPLAVILVSFILFLSFWTWWGVALPLLTVLISVIWAMGAMALFCKPITVVSSAVPVLLIAVGSAYGIHVIERYKEESRRMPHDEVIPQAIGRTGVAILIAATTTMVGFASNAISDISAIGAFGLITALGTAVAFGISITFLPAILCFIHGKSRGEGKVDSPIFRKALAWWSAFVEGNRIIVAIVTVALLAVAVSFFPKITTESDPLKYFNSQSEVVRTANLARDKFGGTISLDILVKGDLKDPNILRKLDALEGRLEKISILKRPYSVVDALKDMNCYLNGGDLSQKKLPPTRDGVAQYLLLISLSNAEYLRNMISSDYTEAVISSRVNITESTAVDKMLAEVKRDIKDVFGKKPGVVIKLSGMAVVIKDMREMLIANQVQSLLLALLFVFLNIIIVYRTFLGSLFCMAPILVTVALTFGIMGWAHISLDIATVMVSSIAVGLGIDYSVHLFNRYREEMALTGDPSRSMTTTIVNVGKAIIYNALSVGAGFLLLTLSQFTILKDFGKLASFAIIFSAVGALAILPDLFIGGKK